MRFGAPTYLDVGVQGATEQLFILSPDVHQIDLGAAHHDPSQHVLVSAHALKTNDYFNDQIINN